jgi:hypothetical protein
LSLYILELMLHIRHYPVVVVLFRLRLNYHRGYRDTP